MISTIIFIFIFWNCANGYVPVSTMTLLSVYKSVEPIGIHLMLVAKQQNNVDIPIREKLMLIEAERLKVLPLDLLTSFEKFWEDYLPVIGAGMLLFNTMLMFLADKSLSHLGQSILPYYITSPIVLATPFITYWAWMLDVVSIPWVDSLVNRYLAYQSKEAQYLLDEQGPELLAAAVSDPDSAVTLACLQLLASMDVDVMADEMRALKTKRAGVRPLQVPSTSYLPTVSAGRVERLLLGTQEDRSMDVVSVGGADTWTYEDLLAAEQKQKQSRNESEEFMRSARQRLDRRSESLVVVPDAELLNTLRTVRQRVRQKEGKVEGLMGLVIGVMEGLEALVDGVKSKEEK